MPEALFLTVLSAALLYALWAAFGETVFAEEAPGGAAEGARRRFDPLPLASRSLLSAFGAGFGGSGALVHASARLSAGAEVGLAVATGLLLAGLVRAIVGLFTD
jgi:hypothetical protein